MVYLQVGRQQAQQTAALTKQAQNGCRFKATACSKAAETYRRPWSQAETISYSQPSLSA